MTTEEIFETINAHFIKGLMFHEQMTNYYDFLGLEGYKNQHKKHYLSESKSHLKLNHYFINHFGKLINESPIENPNIIPESWYRYTRSDVDISTKKNAIKNANQLWVDWERDTKKLLEDMYKELININEIAGAIFIQDLIKDVDKELEQAELEWLTLKSIDYDLVYILEVQEKY